MAGRLKIWNLATGAWEYVALPLHSHQHGGYGTGVPTFAGGGSATYVSPVWEYYQFGRMVIARISWSIGTAGSGTSTVTVATGLPRSATGHSAVGDTGGSGVSRLLARATNSVDSLDLSTITKVTGTVANVQGADLIASQSWSFNWAYMAIDDVGFSGPI